MPIYYEAKTLERAIDATPVLPQTAKNLLKKIIRSAPRKAGAMWRSIERRTNDIHYQSHVVLLA
nr:MAG TPA: hypothetical protein [Caudoviricetes sp.]